MRDKKEMIMTYSTPGSPEPILEIYPAEMELLLDEYAEEFAKAFAEFLSKQSGFKQDGFRDPRTYLERFKESIKTSSSAK